MACARIDVRRHAAWPPEPATGTVVLTGYDSFDDIITATVGVAQSVGTP
jgi:hypothetical protein